MLPNADEIAFWNDEAGAHWVRCGDQLDRAFAPLGAAGLAAAHVRPGEAVLDIGCGCGATLLDLAALVGNGGSVVGIDVSEPMLALAQRRASDRGFGNARCVRADAATHAFAERSVDLAFSRFGVMFFDDPVGAFVNVRRSLRPDGRVAFVCWRDLAANPFFSVPTQAVRPHVPEQAPPDPSAPGPLAFADADRVRAILERAGFRDVRLDPFDAKLRLGDGDRAFALLREVGPAARLLAAAGDDARAAAERALDAALRAHLVAGEVELGAGVWIVGARP